MGSGTGLVHYLTGPEITETAPVTVSGLRGVEPLRETLSYEWSCESVQDARTPRSVQSVGLATREDEVCFSF